jgi:hypothetical protein
MSRLCERPGCAETATVAFGFDPRERMAWLAPKVDDGPVAGSLCRKHADAMTLPRGWWLDDRRGGDALFETVEQETPAPVDEQSPIAQARKTRARKPKAVPDAAAPADAVTDEEATTEAVASDDAGAAAAPASGGPDEPDPGWAPLFDAGDDLGGQLHADTPLLNRAFGGKVVPPPPRRRRPPKAPAAG